MSNNSSWTWPHFLFLFLFLIQSHSVAQAGVQWCDLSSLQPLPPGLKRFSASASQVAENTGASHHTQLIFAFLVEMGFQPYWPGWSQTPDLMICPPQPPKMLGLQA